MSSFVKPMDDILIVAGLMDSGCSLYSGFKIDRNQYEMTTGSSLFLSIHSDFPISSCDMLGALGQSCRKTVTR